MEYSGLTVPGVMALGVNGCSVNRGWFLSLGVVSGVVVCMFWWCFWVAVSMFGCCFWGGGLYVLVSFGGVSRVAACFGGVSGVVVCVFWWCLWSGGPSAAFKVVWCKWFLM